MNMNFFEKWFNKHWVKAYYNWNDDKSVCAAEATNKMHINQQLRASGMNFTVYQASGGYILEYHKYDNNTDQRNNSLHLITSDQDLGQAIGHAITIELLKR